MFDRTSSRRILRRMLMGVLSAVSAASLTACGGGGGGGETGMTPAAVEATVDGRKEAQFIPVTVQPASFAGWTFCASEGQTCSFSGKRQVRYGHYLTFATGNHDSRVACTNTVFGDPAPTQTKGCWYGNSVIDAAVEPEWIHCANESQVCTFTGARTVRYGTATNFVSGTFTDRVDCSNAVFGDPAVAQTKTCRHLAQAEATTVGTATVAPGASGSNPPIVLNHSGSARAGSVVSLQGEEFGAAPKVYLDGAPEQPLEIVNRVDAGSWLAVKLPASTPRALILRVASAGGVSAQVKLNAARPLHLDTMQLAPGGAFKVFGRNLVLAGSTPTVKIDGLAATINLALSNEHVITAKAPSGLGATREAVVSVDNGNGTGSATLDRVISVQASGIGDPYSLGVGWAAAFSTILGTTINAATDPRLPERVSCNGVRDDTWAIRSAIDLAASMGGGVVRLPAGRCRMAGGMEIHSKVVVEGAGKESTELLYASNYPVYAFKVDLAGIRNLTLTNSGPSTEGPLIKESSRVFIQNVRVNLGTSRQMYLTGNQQFVVMNSNFNQGGSISQQGPYTMHGSAGLVFKGNSTRWVNGSPVFGHVHDSVLEGNRFTRDAATQHQQQGAIHSMTLDFAHRVAVLGNVFDVANGPITNKSRNDGETILTEGGGAQRTENLGHVTQASATTLTDSGNSLNVDPFGTGVIPENYGVAIVAGKGAGQTRRITAYSRPVMAVERAWDVVPDATSRYATFVWGLEKSLIKGNVLSQNPRGIWLYHTAVRDVDVVDNKISEGGGIYLRSYQNLATRSFMPIYNVLIARNRITNTTGQWMSYINSVFVNADARSFGIATLGVEMRSNEIVANPVNVVSAVEEYASVEGYMNMMRVENYSGYESSPVPRLLGSILHDNACTNCESAVRIGTGAGGTTIAGTRLTNSRELLVDWATTVLPEKSTSTVVY